MEMLAGMLTWKVVAAGVTGVVATAITARRVRKAAKEVTDVFETISNAQKDGKISADETRQIVKEGIEAALAVAPLLGRFVKKGLNR